MAGSISGTVIDIRTAQPIAGASVAVTGSKSEGSKTSENGAFKEADLPAANNYAMNISAPGYESAHYEDIVVLDNIDTDLQKLALMPTE